MKKPVVWRIRRVRPGVWVISRWVANHRGASFIPVRRCRSGAEAHQVFADGGRWR